MRIRRGTATITALAAGAAITCGWQTMARNPPAQTGPAPAVAPAMPMATSSNWPKGYLPGPLPDAALLSPPPPVAGSSADARDIEGAQMALRLRGTPRWALATNDADLFSPAATGTFSCAAGLAIGPRATPRLDALLRRASRDLSEATSATKDKYKRLRPFMVNHEASCTPEAEAPLRSSGSYPSGHSAIGYGWGLILAELVPDRAARIVARGRAFGDSRRICNVHWLSDTEEGRVAAAATVARLHAEPAFRKDMDAVREEVRQTRAPAAETCAAEAAALATGG